MDIQLNTLQLRAVSTAVAFVATPIKESGRYMAIEGWAGTGKTTCIQKAIYDFPKGTRVVLTAPTNKAVKVLRKAGLQQGVNLPCQTIHSLLGLALLPSEEDKRIIRAGPGNLDSFDAVVVDECSMLNKLALKFFDEALLGTNIKVIFMGDGYQLPPVRENMSNSFNLGKSVQLTKVERQEEGSPVLELTSKVRDCIKNGTRMQNIQERIVDDSGVHLRLGRHFLNDVIERITPETEPDDIRVLAWRNDRVDELNFKIREKLYGKKVAMFIADERIVTTGSVKGPGGEIVLSTDEECLVKYVTQDHVTDWKDGGTAYKVWQMIVTPIHKNAAHAAEVEVVINVLHEADLDKYYARCEELAKDARRRGGSWGDFWEFKETFHEVKHCWAMTVHRSQGSTFKDVYVDLIDIQRNKKREEQLKLIYVATSRPSKNLFVNRCKFVA